MVHLSLRTLLWALPLVLGALHVHADEASFEDVKAKKGLSVAQNGARVSYIFDSGEMKKLLAPFWSLRKDATSSSWSPKRGKPYSATCYFQMCADPNIKAEHAGRYLSRLQASKNHKQDQIDLILVKDFEVIHSDPFETLQKGVWYPSLTCEHNYRNFKVHYYIDQIELDSHLSPCQSFAAEPSTRDVGYDYKGSCCLKH